jgi:ubiquinol-cytochrome c reductase cytochrome b subunit
MLSWLEHRTGLKQFLNLMLLEGVPGGAKWRYVWGSMLAFVFSIQLITGVLLMTAYSPSASQAWSSVHFIQYQMDFGWFIRGLHHFGSQTMMVLIAIHMLQVVIAGAHLPPREWNWWTGIGLLSVTLGLSLTGYLLPWDQKGFWATDVATNIAGTLPEVGAQVKQQAVGGPDSGNHTLTRFFALHVAILPLLLIGLLVVHIVLFRRHGVTSRENQEGFVTNPANEHGANAEPFWPRQMFYDLVACMVVFAVMVGLLFMPHQDHQGDWHFGHGNAVKEGEAHTDWLDYDYWAKAGQRGIGANLDAPADRETSNYPARPEWYFLPLFQLLKYFKGDNSIYGTVVIPNGVMVLLAILPLLGYGPFRKFGHFVAVLVMMTLLIGTMILIALALRDDAPEGILWGTVKHTDAEKLKIAEKFQADVKIAEVAAKRAVQMAMDGTPVDGGHDMLRKDPLTAGYKLFQQKCGSCHNYTAKPGDPFESWNGGKSASDLGDFASEEWIYGLLVNSLSKKHFGLVTEKVDKVDQPIFTGMHDWRQAVEERRKDEKLDEKAIAEEEAGFKQTAAWLANQAKPREQRDPKLFDGQKAFFNGDNRCSGCHAIEKKEVIDGKVSYKIVGGKSAPDLTNYGSAEWIRGMIMSPNHKSRYKGSPHMPAFRPIDGPGSELALKEFQEANKDTQVQPLADIERELIIRFMQRDYRAIYGGAPIR